MFCFGTPPFTLLTEILLFQDGNLIQNVTFANTQPVGDAKILHDLVPFTNYSLSLRQRPIKRLLWSQKAFASFSTAMTCKHNFYYTLFFIIVSGIFLSPLTSSRPSVGLWSQARRRKKQKVKRWCDLYADATSSPMKNEPFFRSVTIHFAKHSKAEERGVNFAYFVSDRLEGKVPHTKKAHWWISLIFALDVDNVEASSLQRSSKASYTRMMTTEVMFWLSDD